MFLPEKGIGATDLASGAAGKGVSKVTTPSVMLPLCEATTVARLSRSDAGK